MTRIWTNVPAGTTAPAGTLALNAADLNAMEADISTAKAIRWTPSTFYAAGTAVINPSGDTVKANADHTSGSTYNAANWSSSGTYILAASKGAASGVASLDSTTRIPTAQVPTTVPAAWQPNTAYAAGQPVVSPSGDIVTAKAAFTSSSSFNAANWNYSTTYVQSSAVGAANGVASLDSHGLVPASQIPTSSTDYGYLYAGFTLDTYSERMTLAQSSDGHTFVYGQGSPFYSDPNTGTSFRDPSIVKIGSTWFCAYTVNNGINKNFGVIKSTDLMNWTSLTGVANTPTLIDCSSATGINKCWAPELIVDNSGNVYAFWTNEIDPGTTNSIWYTKFTDNTGLTTWNAPVALSWTTAPSYGLWDATFVYDSTASLWRGFFATSNNTINRAYCSTLTGSWTMDKTGDWAGWNANSPFANTVGSEAPELTYRNGTWRMYMDPFCGTAPYSRPGMMWSESTDLTTWTSPKACATNGFPPGQVMRHGGFVAVSSQTDRNTVVDAMCARPPLRHAEYTATASFTSGTEAYCGTITLDSSKSLNYSADFAIHANGQLQVLTTGFYDFTFHPGYDSNNFGNGTTAHWTTIYNDTQGRILARDVAAGGYENSVDVSSHYAQAGDLIGFKVAQFSGGTQTIDSRIFATRRA